MASQSLGKMGPIKVEFNTDETRAASMNSARQNAYFTDKTVRLSWK